MTNIVKWSLEHMSKPAKNICANPRKTQQLHGTKNIRQYSPKTIQKLTRGHYFLSLHTGKRILRNHLTVLPMPNDVVDAVHRLAAASKQAGGITFTDKDGNITPMTMKKK